MYLRRERADPSHAGTEECSLVSGMPSKESSLHELKTVSQTSKGENHEKIVGGLQPGRKRIFSSWAAMSFKERQRAEAAMKPGPGADRSATNAAEAALVT